MGLELLAIPVLFVLAMRRKRENALGYAFRERWRRQPYVRSLLNRIFGRDWCDMDYGNFVSVWRVDGRHRVGYALNLDSINEETLRSLNAAP